MSSLSQIPVMPEPERLLGSRGNWRQWRLRVGANIRQAGYSRCFEDPPLGSLYTFYTRLGDDVKPPADALKPIKISGDKDARASARARIGKGEVGVEAEDWSDMTDWAAQQDRCSAYIINSVDSSEWERLASAHTVKEQLAALKAEHHQSPSHAALRAVGILAERWLGSEEIDDYFKSIENAIRDLSEAEASIPEPLVALFLLNGMPSELWTTVDALLAASTIEKLKPAAVKVALREAVRRREDGVAANRASGGGGGVGQQPSTAPSTSGKASKASKPSTSSSKKPSGSSPCPGHPKGDHSLEDCYVFNKFKENGLVAAGSTSKMSGASKSMEAYSASVASEPADSLLRAKASKAACRRSKTKPHLDSGADRHFFHERDAFWSYTPFNPPREIEIANGIVSPALGRGLIKLRDRDSGETIDLPGSWHAPEFVVDLVSTGQLAQLGYTSTTRPGDECTVGRGDSVILRGRKSVLDAEIATPRASANAAVTMDTWHGRFMHANKRSIEKTVNSDAVTGLDIAESPDRPFKDDVDCGPCVLGKSHRFPFGDSDSSDVKPGEILVFDLFGPVKQDHYGNRYALTGRDVGSRCGFAWLLKRKNDAEAAIIEAIDRWKNEHPDRKFNVVCVRSDLGGEFKSRSFERKLVDRGIKHEYATRATPQSNGIAERSHRTDTNAAATSLAAAMCADRRLPPSMWGFAYLSSVYAGNFIVRARTGDKTPLELFTGKKPDVSHLRVWGCEAFVHTLKMDRKSRFAPKSSACSFVGYGQLDGFKAYYVYVPATRKVILSRDVVFREAPLVATMRASKFDIPPDVPPADDTPAEPAPSSPATFEVAPDRLSVGFPTPAPAQPIVAPDPLPPLDPHEPAPQPAVEPEPVIPDAPDVPQTPEMAPADADQSDLREVSLNEIPPDSPPSPVAPPAPSVHSDSDDDIIPPPRIIVAAPENRPAPRPPPKSAPQRTHPPLPPIRERRVYQPQPWRGPGKGSAAIAIVDTSTAAANPSGVCGRSSQDALACAIPGHRSHRRAPDGASDGSANDELDTADQPGQTGAFRSASSTSTSSSPPTCSSCSKKASSTSAELNERKSAAPSCVCGSHDYTKGLRPPGCADPTATPAPRRSVVIEDDDEDYDHVDLPSIGARSAAAVPPRLPRVKHIRVAKKMRRGVRIKAPNPRPRTFYAHDVRDRFDAALGFMASVGDDGVGLSQAQAHADPVHGPHWIAAEQAELDSLTSKGTFDFCDVPKGHYAIRSHFVYKIKRRPDGSIDRYKARLVVNGNSQRPGTYGETYAPTAKLASVRLGVSLATLEDLDIHQMDVDSAFVQADVDEELYVRLPDGRTARLRKALYGLKQASFAWYKAADTAFGTLGFKRTSADECVYVNHSYKGHRIIILLYVDDLLIIAPPDADVPSLKIALQAKWAMKDLGETSYFLGLEIKRDRPNRRTWVHQSAYARDVLAVYGYGQANPASTPLVPSTHLVPATDEESAFVAKRELDADRPYARLVGSLQWLALATRPDMAQAVSELARFVAKPTDEHWHAAHHVLRYLNGTSSLGLLYGVPVEDESARLFGWSDADWAGCPTTRRSRTAYAFKYGHGAVSWSSRMQPTVSLSTVEAEFKALSEAAREGIWLVRLVGDLGRDHDGPLVLLNDNTGAEAVASNAANSSKLKHVALQYHFIRERVASGEIALEHTPTHRMAADSLTKAVPVPAHQRCLDQLRLDRAPDRSEQREPSTAARAGV